MLIYTCLGALLILAILIFYSLFAYYYRRYYLCYNDPKIQCWDDWQCPCSQICPDDHVLPGNRTCWPKGGYKEVLKQYGLYEEDPNNAGCRFPSNSNTLPPNCPCAWRNVGKMVCTSETVNEASSLT